MSTVWSFKSGHFVVSLEVTEDYGYQYDGDDENGEVQAKLDSGEYVAFDSSVYVRLNGRTIGEDHLGGSVYGVDEMADFWEAHRTSEPAYRNCSVSGRPAGTVIGHYFPDMVRTAVREARATLAADRAIRLRAA